MQERFEDERRRNEALAARIEAMREEVESPRAEAAAEEADSAHLDKKPRTQAQRKGPKKEKLSSEGA